MIHNATTKFSNLEKLATYINSQPNPRAFASALLAIAALRTAASTTGEQAREEVQSND